jgi:hypothetical protein
MIKDFRNPPDGDITHQISTTPTPLIVTYSQEIDDRDVIVDHEETPEDRIDDLAIDQETRRAVTEIFESITKRGFWGKLRLDGTAIPPAGHLPAIGMRDERRNGDVGDNDYGVYGSEGITRNTEVLALDVFTRVDSYFKDQYHYNKETFDNQPGHLITRTPSSNSNTDIVDYVFFDPQSFLGRRIGLTHVTCEMPRERANEFLYKVILKEVSHLILMSRKCTTE